FSVDNKLFKVPRHRFEQESQIFRDMFKVPSGDNRPDGMSDEQPLHLTGISRAHFQSLLKVLYPRQVQILSIEEWVGALHLATMWDMARIRKFVILSLNQFKPLLDAASRAALGKQYNVEQWYFAGLVELVKRAKHIELTEANILGIETVLKITELRERCRVASPPLQSVSRANQNSRDRHGRVEDDDYYIGTGASNSNFASLVKQTMYVKEVKESKHDRWELKAARGAVENLDEVIHSAVKSAFKISD
ncbi:hypothetical protein C8J56DRAFT_783010, partial [Mycena floridula]